MGYASTIDPALMEALHVTEVRDADALAELTRQRARATDGGCMTYRVSHSRESASPADPLTTFGNISFGNLLFSAISDRVDTEVEIIGKHPLALCLTAVLRGRFSVTAPASGKMNESGAVQITRIEPGMRAETAEQCERINLFINLSRLERDIERALDRPLQQDLRFALERDWPVGLSGSLRRLITYAAAELADPYSSLAGGVGLEVFEDLLARTLIDGVPHNYTEAIERKERPVSKLAVRRARELIRSSPARLPISEIAALVDCSPRRLAAAFRSEFGQSLVAAQRDARLDAAERLLKQPDPARRLSDVAATCGFSNVSRFSRQYRQRFGRSPR